MFVLYGFFCLIVCALTWGLTAQVRNYALKKNVLDIPNERSSHSVPTPRGGGISVVIVFLAVLCILAINKWITVISLISFFGAGSLVSVVGFLDDHGHIAARWRLLAHFGSAIFIVFMLGGLPPVSLLGINVNLSALGYVIGVLYLVWLLNLYNFMDGIDGLASIEAITVCIGSSVCSLILHQWTFTESATLSIVLASAVAGFMIWNYPPAKIFMGDACSGFLGLMLGALSLLAGWENSLMLWCSLILLAVFITDATVTLFRRLIRGEKLYEAHRSHAYQYASRYFSGHKPVTIFVALINICWLFPIALCVAIGWLDGYLAVLIAYIPMIAMAYKFKAGAAEFQND